jgi:hypothetical protein
MRNAGRSALLRGHCCRGHLRALLLPVQHRSRWN